MSIVHVYHSEGITDLSKMQEEARDRANGKNVYVRHPGSTVLHLHPHKVVIEGFVEPFQVMCKGGAHQFYQVGSDDLLTLSAGSDIAPSVEQLTKNTEEYLNAKASELSTVAPAQASGSHDSEDRVEGMAGQPT